MTKVIKSTKVMNRIKIHPTLQEKLLKTKEDYIKVTAFAELLPMYSTEILRNEAKGDRFFQLSSYHKKIYAAWGINWYTNVPNNYPAKTSEHEGFVNIYINCMSLFGDELYGFAHETLADALCGIKVHFYDRMNSTFYFLPEEAEEGLDKLNDWYISTKEKTDSYLKQIRKEKLQSELDKLNQEESK